MGLINKQILIVNQKRIKEIIDKITPKERHPTGENTTAVLESTQLPWRTEHTNGDVPGQVPRNIRDSATRTPSPPPVPENVVPSESLETEMNLLDLEDSRSNRTESPDPTLMGINASSDPDQDGPTDIGLLPVIYHVFEDTNTATTILLDEGTNTSLITTKMAQDLSLKGKIMLTKICKAGDEFTHHVVDLKD